MLGGGGCYARTARRVMRLPARGVEAFDGSQRHVLGVLVAVHDAPEMTMRARMGRRRVSRGPQRNPKALNPASKLSEAPWNFRIGSHETSTLAQPGLCLRDPGRHCASAHLLSRLPTKLIHTAQGESAMTTQTHDFGETCPEHEHHVMVAAA